jgi:predicted MPP superfamily phosphohydrolase
MKRFLKIFASIIVIFVIAVIYSFIEPYWVEVKETEIVSKDIPEAFDNTKIVFLSDIHLGPLYSLDRLKGLVKQVNKLEPDIVLLGGDYVYKGTQYIEPCFNELKNLKTKLGIFGVLGNHDHWENADMVRDSMAKAGISLLDNNAQWVYKDNQRIKLGGVGDLWSDYQDISPTITDIRKEDFSILLSHNPDYADSLRTDNIDLMISGHTHGGQITFFGHMLPFGRRVFNPKYRSGLIETEHTKLLVSNGIGSVWTLPVRFCARPQINVVYLKK